MRIPKLWRKPGKGGKRVGNWYVTIKGEDVNLGTKDAQVATKNARKAVLEGVRDFTDKPDAAAAAMPDTVADPPPPMPFPDAAPAPAAAPAPPPAAPAAPAAPPAPAPTAPPALSPMSPDPQEFADTAAAAEEAAGAGADEGAGGAEGADPEVADITNEQLAGIGVHTQVWIAAWHARRTVYKGFIPPPTPEEVRAPLEVEWKKILAYANVSALMPPWVTGLLIPGVTLIGATYAMALGFGAIAEEQRKAAGAPPQGEPKPPEAAAA